MITSKAVLFLSFVGFLQIWSNASHLVAKDAECTPLKDCPHIHELTKTQRNSYGVITLLNLLHCPDNRRQIYLKCIDASKVKDFMERADLIPNYDTCGLENLAPRISGGEVTAIDDYPWIALLKYRNSAGDVTYGCHGSLISRRYLLTAAHCVHPEQLQKRRYRNIQSVVLGEYDVTSNKDCAGTDCVSNQTKEVSIESYEIHPEYNISTFLNDIALVRLAAEVEYTDFIKPICMPPNILISPFNESLWIAGWGTTEDNEMNKVKVRASFQLDKPDTCVASNLNLTSKQFCARSTDSSKTCPGDSGGPLMRRIPSRDSVRLFLIGVDSLGTDCRRVTRHFAIYTKVAPYVEWILLTIHK